MPESSDASANPSRPSPLSALAWAACALPFALFLYNGYRFALDLPYYDQWDFIPHLRLLFADELTFEDIWRTHNEHRPFFPKLIMLALARATHWNILAEILANHLLGVAIFAVVAAQIYATARHSRLPRLILCVPAAAVLCFSPAQWENWYWGWQIQMLLGAGAALCACIFLAKSGASLAALFIAASFGFLSTFSFANGLTLWPIGLATLLYMYWTSREPRLFSKIFLWLVLSTTTLAIFFANYSRGAQSPDPTFGIHYPFHYIDYVLKFLGAPVVNFHPVLTSIAGAAGLLLFAALVIHLHREGRSDVNVWLPYVLLAVYSIATAAMTGIGRIEFGPEQALAPRYTTLATPFWIALTVLTAYVFLSVEQNPRRRRAAHAAIALGAALLAAATFATHSKSIAHARDHYEMKLRLRAKLLEGDTDAYMRNLYPHVNELSWRRDILERLELSVYRNVDTAPSGDARPSQAPTPP